MLACLFPPRQLATGPTELRGFSRAHGAEEDTVHRARHFMHMCMLSHKHTQEHSHARTHTQPPLITARLLKFYDLSEEMFDSLRSGQGGKRGGTGHIH